MTDDLVETDRADTPGDEFESIDVDDTEATRIARRQDRAFDEFRMRIENSERLKLEESVFDEATYGALYKLVQDGAIEAFGGPVSTGKEANVYTALGGSLARDVLGLPAEAEPEVAVKMYRISASDFRDMRDYLEGDPRFEGIGGDKKDVVLAWTRKEYANLARAGEGGVRVPAPVAVERNALVMEYIGADGERGRRLAEVDVENPETAYEVVRENTRRLYEAGLVHGDLSEYNLVVQDGEMVVLDLGQALTVHHPNAREFLERDCRNVTAFFGREGYEVDPEAMLAYVTGEETDGATEGAEDDAPGAGET